MRTTSPLAVIFLTVALDLVGFGMVVPLLPLYAQQLGATGKMVALLFASYSLMQFLCAPLWGRLSDRVGRRRVLLGSITANAVALLMYGLATSYGWLLVARLLAGVFAANISVANAYVADVTSEANRAKGMGLVGAAFGIGFVIGPFLGGELSQFGSATPALVASGLAAVNALVAFWALPESLPQGARAGGRSASHPEGVWRERWRVLRQGQVSPIVLGLIFVQVLGFSMMEMALVLFAKVRLGFDAQAAGRLFAFVGVVLVVVQGGLINRMVRRFGEVKLVGWGLLVVAIALAAIPFTPQTGQWYLLGALAVMALGQGTTSPSLSSLLSRSAPATMQGTALGLSQSVSSLARVVGPQAAGLLFDWGSENDPFWAGSTVLLAAAILARLRLVDSRAAL